MPYLILTCGPHTDTHPPLCFGLVSILWFLTTDIPRRSSFPCFMKFYFLQYCFFVMLAIFLFWDVNILCLMQRSCTGNRINPRMAKGDIAVLFSLLYICVLQLSVLCVANKREEKVKALADSVFQVLPNTHWIRSKLTPSSNFSSAFFIFMALSLQLVLQTSSESRAASPLGNLPRSVSTSY